MNSARAVRISGDGGREGRHLAKRKKELREQAREVPRCYLGVPPVTEDGHIPPAIRALLEDAAGSVRPTPRWAERRWAGDRVPLLASKQRWTQSE